MLRIVLFLLCFFPISAHAYGDMAKPKTGVCLGTKDLTAALISMGYVSVITAANEKNLLISYFVNETGAYVAVVDDGKRACIFTQGDAIYVNVGQGI